jgi:hypothetical protein
MEDTKASRVSVGIHAVVGIAVGYASLFLSSGWFALGLAIVVLIALGWGIEKIVGARGRKWWVGNGAFIYFLIWIVSWVFFFNIFLV